MTRSNIRYSLFGWVDSGNVAQQSSRCCIPSFIPLPTAARIISLPTRSLTQLSLLIMGLSRSKPVPQPSAVVKDYQWDALPKHSYHQLPETEFDDFPIADDAGAASVAAAYRITSDDLRALYTLDERAHSVSKALLESIQRSRYAVLVLGDDDMHLVREGFRIAKAFLELPTERKAEIALPHHESGRRNRFSGYSQLRFDNCTARRVRRKHLIHFE